MCPRRMRTKHRMSGATPPVKPLVTRRRLRACKVRSLLSSEPEREVRMKKLAFICTVCATLHSGILFASVLEPKESVAEYPFACAVEGGSLGVDYLRRMPLGVGRPGAALG